MGDLLNLGGGQFSQPQLQNVFGGIPYGIAGQLNNEISPILKYLGFGPQAGTARAENQGARLAGATGPLAGLLQQIRGEAPNVGPESQAAGNQISAVGSQAFTDLFGQVNNLLQTQLPQAQQYASQYAQEAFGPESQTPFYAAETQRAVQPIRSDFAARGLGDSGAELSAEQQASSDISQNIAQQQLGLQPGAAVLGPELAGQGIGAAGNRLSAVPEYGQALQSQYQTPLQALSGLFQLLTGGQAGGLSLLGATAPQISQVSGPLGPFGIRVGSGGTGK